MHDERCPRCHKLMVQNCYASADNWFCRRCGLWIELNDDGEIVGTNEDVRIAFVLRVATGGAARRIYERPVQSHAKKLVSHARESARSEPTQRPRLTT